MCCGCGCGLAVALAEAEARAARLESGPGGIQAPLHDADFDPAYGVSRASSARGWEALKRSLRSLVGGGEAERPAAPVVASAA